MDIHQNKDKFAGALIEWFKKEGRQLPWRETQNPYYILVSEIMLQQTQVATVIPYYLRFIEKLPTIEDLAQVSEETIHSLWEGLGYYSRVKRLQQFARIVTDKYQGEIPSDPEILKDLPGIGPYTLGALLSFAFHIKEPAIDGNVKRVITRLADDFGDISKVDTNKRLDNIVREILPDEIYPFNQGLIELGATYCTPKNPNCKSCPVSLFCKATALGHCDMLPNKPKKQKQKMMKVPVIILKAGEEILFVKRKTTGLLANLWGLPIFEEDEGQIHFFLEDYLGLQIIKEDIHFIGSIKHVFSHIIWNQQVYLIEDLTLKERLITLEDPIHRWSEPGKISIPTAFKKVIASLPERS